MATGSAENRAARWPGRRARLGLLAALVVLVALSTWLRTTPAGERLNRLEVTPLEAVSQAEPAAGLSLEGLWRLDSPDLMFGGFSALLVHGNRLRAFSDSGERLAFTLPGRGPPAPSFATVPQHLGLAHERPDIEAATFDPATGRLWLAYEQVHAIRRFGPGDGEDAIIRPETMHDWQRNGGAEAMARLADGRFLAFGERNRTGLLFPGDPLDGGAPESFTVAWPPGWRPVDTAALPDGRVLILMRRVVRDWPPFRSMLMVGDPRAIVAGTVWRPTKLARLDPLLPYENYEGLAVRREGGALTIWLIADDNFSTFQRTLLARLRWRP